VKDLKVEAQVLVPQLRLVLGQRALAERGLTPKAVTTALTTLLNGATVGQVILDQKSFDVVVIGHPSLRDSESALEDLDIDLPSGQGTVKLRAVGRLVKTRAPNTIRHDRASRCIDVTCNVTDDADIGAVAREVEARVAKVGGEGYSVEVLGEY